MNRMTPKEACLQFWGSVLYIMKGLGASLTRDANGAISPRTVLDIANDPTDKLTLKLGEDEEETIQMYSTAWMRSLDYLLYRYFTLVLHTKSGPSEISVPNEVQEKFKYRTRLSERQQKKLDRITPDYMSELTAQTRTRDKLDYSVYHTSSHFGPALLNLFCHELFNRTDNMKWRRSPRIDALAYQFKRKNSSTRESYKIYDYKLEDYFAHELLTGISLSTEITAVLLDLDEEIREIAFRKFCKYALGKIVRLPFPYARASAARYFFMQIRLEWVKRKNQWDVINDKKWITEAVDQFASEAILYIDTLHMASLRPEYPSSFQESRPADDEEMLELLRRERLRKTDFTMPQGIEILEEKKEAGEIVFNRLLDPWWQTSYPPTDDPMLIAAYKEQIKVNLEAVASPLNWEQVSKEIAHNLVAFTNPNHKYIPILLTYLEDGRMDPKGSRKILPVTHKDCETLFAVVHHAIREASMIAYSDMTWIDCYLNRI